MSKHHDPTAGENWPREALVPLGEPFVDERGVITPLVEGMIRSVLMISSKKGTVRGNHYHLTDWHYCYVVSGAMEYYYRPAGSKHPPQCVEARAGQLVLTPPMVEHAMEFLEDTVFLTLSGNPRDQKAYEADIVRLKLI